MHWLLRWSSPAHSCHVLIITSSDTTDLIWFELIFSLMIKKENGETLRKGSRCSIPAFRFPLIGPLGNYNYSSKQAATFVADWPRQGLHHSWGMICICWNLFWKTAHPRNKKFICSFSCKKILLPGFYKRIIPLGVSKVTLKCLFLWFLLKYAISPDHRWKFLQSLLGLLDFISLPILGTLGFILLQGENSVPES